MQNEFEFAKREEVIFGANQHMATVEIGGVELAFTADGTVWRAICTAEDSDNDVFVKLPCIEQGCSWERDDLSTRLDEVCDAMMVWLNGPETAE